MTKDKEHDSINIRARFLAGRWNSFNKAGPVQLISRRFLIYLLIFITAWLLISYAVVTTVMGKRLEAELDRHHSKLKQAAEASTAHFKNSINHLYGLPAVVAEYPLIKTAVRSNIAASLPQNTSPEVKKSVFVSQPVMMELNRYLAFVNSELGNDQLFVINSTGDCIASNNYDQANSLVGTNYADRAYFKSAMAGQRGRQYAVGRLSGVPGFFFSAPVHGEKTIIGVVVAKITAPDLANSLNRFNCFITDANGVIVLSSNKMLEYFAINDAPIFGRSPEEREKQYKRRDFPVLKVDRASGMPHPYLTTLFPDSTTPYMLSKSLQDKDGYTIYTYTHMTDINRYRELSLQFAILLSITGSVVILLIGGIRRYLGDMRQAVAQSDAANVSKSQFLANMSHEIRTPMAAIIGLADLALKTQLSPVQRDYLEKITTSSRSLLSILNDVLDHSKVEAGKLILESVAFSLQASLEKVASIINVQARLKGLTFRTEVAPDVPQVIAGDPLRLEQVLLNLLGNAVKFTPQGGVELAVTLIEASTERLALEFRISDTGIGLTPEQCVAIFVPFTQGDSSTTRRFGGTGLGISICQRLVALMKGEITVESEPGRGSNFRFTAYFQPASVEELPLVTTPVQRDIIVIRGARVLLVEDQPINQQIARVQLSQVGLQVTVAADGREAVDLVMHAPEPFDLVLMDIQMPEMDGYEATRRLREQWNREELPIIAMTAYALPEERQKCLAAGMNDHLTKPIEVADLHEKLCRWLKHRSGLSDVPEGTGESIAFVANFPNLHGVCMVEGLARMGGNQALYRSLLRQFVRDNSQVAERLSTLLNSGDLSNARMVAHTLKGVAGNLGLKDFAASAADLETAFIRNDLSTACSGLADLENRLAQVLASVTELELLLPAEPRHAGAPPMAAELPVLCEELTRQLLTRNLQALDLFDQLHSTLELLCPAETVHKLTMCMEHLDFTGAMGHWNECQPLLNGKRHEWG